MLKRLTHDISTGDGVVGYGVYISTGDDVVEYRTVDLYWGRSSRIWCCRSLWLGLALYVSTGDGVVDYPNVDLYWGRCGREWGNRSLLGTEG